jgi:hypothetical protein
MSTLGAFNLHQTRRKVAALLGLRSCNDCDLGWPAQGGSLGFELVLELVVETVNPIVSVAQH